MSLRIALLLVALMMIGACTSTENGDPAASVVESYLEAKVNNDAESITELICSDLESEIEREVASFASVEASIEDMSCISEGNTVTCTGKIVALYGTENREFPLSTYQVVQEDGAWRWCGEGE